MDSKSTRLLTGEILRVAGENAGRPGGHDPVEITRGISIETALPPPSTGGYSCWDSAACTLCGQFRDKRTVYSLFRTGKVELGTGWDLFSSAGRQHRETGARCRLSSWLLARFIRAREGERNINVPLEGSKLMLHWDGNAMPITDNLDRAVWQDGKIPGFTFALQWLFAEAEGTSVWVKIVRHPISMKCFVDELGNPSSPHPISQYLGASPANPNVGSDQSFEKAKAWYMECMRDHEACFAGRVVGESPARVVEITTGQDLSSPPKVCLVAGAGMDKPYAALSYCWGGDQDFKTTQSNVGAYEDNIPFESLPQTIKDAILCAVRLGIRYIWIDSLCIIQDSATDKSREVARMCTIYRNAAVTIMAATAASCNEGFLGNRAEVQAKIDRSFRLPILVPRNYDHLCEAADRLSTDEAIKDFENTKWASPESWHDEPSTLQLSVSGDDPVIVRGVGNEPLSRRGWTLQEWLLSRRKLIFGPSQLQWECATCKHSDGGEIQMVQHGGIDPSILSTLHAEINISVEDGESLAAVQELVNQVSHARKQLAMRLWQQVLVEYSKRDLTVASDKLDAVKGVAQELSRLVGGENVAGLWKSHLLQGLAWYQKMRVLADTKNHLALRWNPDRDCPSWSWTKVDGPLDFLMWDTPTASVMSADMTREETVGQHPNSRLHLEGSITLRARVVRHPQLLGVFRGFAPDDDLDKALHRIYLDGGITNRAIAIEVNSEGRRSIEAPHNLAFVELGRDERAETETDLHRTVLSAYGLVLLPVSGGSSAYHRVGFFTLALQIHVPQDSSSASEEPLPQLIATRHLNLTPIPLGLQWEQLLEEELITII